MFIKLTTELGSVSKQVVSGISGSKLLAELSRLAEIVIPEPEVVEGISSIKDGGDMDGTRRSVLNKMNQDTQSVLVVLFNSDRFLPADSIAYRLKMGLGRVFRSLSLLEQQDFVVKDIWPMQGVDESDLDVFGITERGSEIVLGPVAIEQGNQSSYDFPEQSTARRSTNKIVDLTGRAVNVWRKGFKNRVFIVHGHDNEIKQTVARFLELLGIDAVILHEQPNKGKTIIEKFEEYSVVDYAIVLLSPDDIGTAKSEPRSQSPRARQNVIFELGFFVGRLGRGRVCILCKDKVEIPSDYQGVVYTQFDNAGGWKNKLVKEMLARGIHIAQENLEKAL
ncbi:MAG: nucleotide-binding protein [candidate division WOR-3 bacterium]|nr:nucleotide-binding protein [candidate division WOR-3 bacterium]